MPGNCLIAMIAQKNRHGPVGTFDRKLARIDNTAGLG